ncbi:Peroxiredoxin [Tepidibacter aestuarii]|nr:Peroxiredoxin [Tepidibacter aestuarii]
MYNPYFHLMNQKRYMKPMKKNRTSNMRTKKTLYYDKGFNLGDPAPEFTLKGIVDGEPKDVSLSDYRGKWVVVFFYGSDFTFV